MRPSRVLQFEDRTGKITGPVWILTKIGDEREVLDAFVEWRTRTRSGRVCELQHILSVEQGLRANVTADRKRAIVWARALRGRRPFTACTKRCVV